MPLELVFPGPGTTGFCEFALPDLRDDEVCVRTKMTGIQHGEDLYILRQNGEAGLFPHHPMTWGCGEIITAGPQVTRFKPGEMVHGPMLHREVQWVSERLLYPLEWMKPEFSVFIEPGTWALHCVREAGIRYGDRVAVIGMGAIGLIALQYVLASGGMQVWAVDPIFERLQVAQRLGAHHLWAPGSQEKWGADQLIDCCDVGIELSGTDAGLLSAGSIVCPGGILCCGGGRYSQKIIQSIQVSCRKKEIDLRWISNTRMRASLEAIVVQSIASKRVIVWPILSDLVPFDEAPQFYQKLQETPAHFLKSIITYSG